MKVLSFATVALVLVFTGCVSPPPDVLVIPEHLPPHVSAKFQEAESAMRFLKAALVSFKKVGPRPYRNVHGEEWPVYLRVHKVYGGDLKGDEISFGTSDPKSLFKARQLYFLVISTGMHGAMIDALEPAP